MHSKCQCLFIVTGLAHPQLERQGPASTPLWYLYAANPHGLGEMKSLPWALKDINHHIQTCRDMLEIYLISI